MKNFMKKSLVKTGVAALCVASLASLFAGCGKKGGDDLVRIGVPQLDVYTYVGNALSGPLGATGENRVTAEGDIVRVDIASNVNEVEFDLAKFFNENPEFKGKDFYFTRDDVKKGDNTLIKGFAWVEVEPGNSASRKYKKIGFENDDSVTAITKQEIVDLANRGGESRMYFLTSGTQNGKCLVYIDPSLSSNIETGETRVTFKLHGHNGQTAELQTKVVK